VPTELEPEQPVIVEQVVKKPVEEQAESENEDEEDEEDAKKNKKKRSLKKKDTNEEDFKSKDVLGIPQELVLPAAITFLGVVIFGVFVLSRVGGSSRR
jgi:hypothetical protein